MDLNEVFYNIQQVIILLRHIVHLLMIEISAQNGDEVQDMSFIGQVIVLLQQTINLLTTENDAHSDDEEETKFIVNLQ